MWVDNIELDIAEIGLGGVDWTRVSLDRYRWRALVNVVMNFWLFKILGNY
jgi:hypothetical protein